MTSATAVDAAVRAYLERDADYADLTSDTAIEQRVGSIRRRRRAARVSVVATCAFMVLAGVALVNHDPAPSGPRVTTDGTQEGRGEGKAGSTPTTNNHTTPTTLTEPTVRINTQSPSRPAQNSASPSVDQGAAASPAPARAGAPDAAAPNTPTPDPATDTPVVSPPTTSVVIPPTTPTTVAPTPPPVVLLPSVDLTLTGASYSLQPGAVVQTDAVTGAKYVDVASGDVRFSVTSDRTILVLLQNLGDDKAVGAFALSPGQHVEQHPLLHPGTYRLYESFGFGDTGAAMDDRRVIDLEIRVH